MEPIRLHPSVFRLICVRGGPSGYLAGGNVRQADEGCHAQEHWLDTSVPMLTGQC